MQGLWTKVLKEYLNQYETFYGAESSAYREYTDFFNKNTRDGRTRFSKVLRKFNKNTGEVVLSDREAAAFTYIYLKYNGSLL